MARPLSLAKQLLISLVIAGGAVALWYHPETVKNALGLSAAEGKAAAARPVPSGVPVITTAALEARDILVFEAVGTGRAERSITLRAKADGTVVSSKITADRRFRADEILLELDDRKETLAVSLAETEAADAARTLARFAQLQTSGTAALATLDEAQTRAAIARLAVERARETLSDRRVVAPFDGVSGLALVEVGDRVESGDPIASFDDRRQILVELDLPEGLLARVGQGTAVEATTPAYPGQVFDGVVVAVDSRIDPTSRTARLRVALPNEGDLLRPGASFSLRLRIDGGLYPAVPEIALQFDRAGLHVWVVRDGRVTRSRVRLVRRLHGSVLVEGALAEGEPVVIEGMQRLREGRGVRVVGETGTQGS
ncbi:MAG: efflux RND transporter periplasmic adaptor subunit [Pseudomonadota bacterium]